MTTTSAPRYGSPEHHAWLLACATRLAAAGRHDLARQARADADALTTPPAPAAERTQLPCEDCGRPAGTATMPADWPLDWWSHRLAGLRCRRTR